VKKLVETAEETGYLLLDDSIQKREGLTHVKLSGPISSSNDITLALGEDGRVVGYKRQAKLWHPPERVFAFYPNDDESLNHQARSITVTKGEAFAGKPYAQGNVSIHYFNEISFGRWVGLHGDEFLKYLSDPSKFFTFADEPGNLEKGLQPDLSVDYTIASHDGNDVYFDPTVMIRLPERRVRVHPRGNFVEIPQPAGDTSPSTGKGLPTTLDGFAIKLTKEFDGPDRNEIYRIELASDGLTRTLDFPVQIKSDVVSRVGIPFDPTWHQLRAETPAIPTIHPYNMR